MNELLIQQFNNLIEYFKNILDTVDDNKDKMKLTFKLKHFKNALNIIKRHPEKITTGNDLKYYHGIGKGIIERVDEILKTGKLSEIKKVTNRTKVIDELTQINGIGPVKAKELIDVYQIKSINDLKNKYKKGIVPLPHAVSLGLKYYEDMKELIPRDEITKIYTVIRDIAENIDDKLIVKACGSYRRKKNISGDIDILITHEDILTKTQYLKKLKDINYISLIVNQLKNNNKNVIIVDDIFEDYNVTYNGYIRYNNNPVRRIDIKFVPYTSWYSALLHYTGSGIFNQIMRNKAKKLGYKLNEYGLFKEGKMMKIESEKDIFDKLNMEYVAPSKRDII
jgi:DNA polymerase/3'-5' exonuclease PolX